MAGTPIEEIIDFAIDKEREAVLFYESLADKVDNPVMKETILSMADEERKHEKILKDLSIEKISMIRQPTTPDLKISDFLAHVTASPDMSYQDLLIVAMKREEKAYALYSDLERLAPDDATRKVFTLLKGEELKHKNSLEKEYEEHVMWED